MTVWALFLRQQSGYGGFENEILKKMTAAAGTSATVIFFRKSEWMINGRRKTAFTLDFFHIRLRYFHC